MIFYVMVVATILLSFELYKRFIPIKGIPCKEDVVGYQQVVIDIRDYNERNIFKKVSIQIPYAYLRRNYREIPNQPLHVIATNQVELNLGLRFLLRRGFDVRSYEILECPCREKRGILSGT